MTIAAHVVHAERLDPPGGAGAFDDDRVAGFEFCAALRFTYLYAVNGSLPPDCGENTDRGNESQWTRADIFSWRPNYMQAQDMYESLSDAGHINLIHRQPSIVRSSEKIRR